LHISVLKSFSLIFTSFAGLNSYKKNEKEHHIYFN